MSGPSRNLLDTLSEVGHSLATEDDYEHGYQRPAREDSNRYVAFRMGAEIYALPIGDVSEISKAFPLTPVPRSASFVLGIGNVRGTVLPVIDLAVRLGVGPCQIGRAARILIATLADEHYGLFVEEVLEVSEVATQGLEAAPGGIGSTRADYIRALGRYDGKIMIILDLTTVLAAREFVAPSFRPRARGGRVL
ncbi:MAG: hypothetical protein B7733_18470 [Myxococcales bacterium FL481]|nr:MAG: hypothetical protein B7733_18470 [Myxococcales bacterium FL481]